MWMLDATVLASVLLLFTAELMSRRFKRENRERDFQRQKFDLINQRLNMLEGKSRYAPEDIIDGEVVAPSQKHGGPYELHLLRGAGRRRGG